MPVHFGKLNPYIFEDKHNILDKMEGLCCHNCSVSYLKDRSYIIWVSVFHKGGFQFNVKYNYKKKALSYKINKNGCRECLKQALSIFITNNNQKIKHFFTKDVWPIHSAIFENNSWATKRSILDSYLYKDINNIIKQYLCYFKKCNSCKNETSAEYDKCYDCYRKSFPHSIHI